MEPFRHKLSNISGFFRAIGRGMRRLWRLYIHQFVGRPWWRKLIAGILSFLFLIVFYIFSVCVNLFGLFGKSPSVEQIRHPKTAAASEIYSADGVYLGKFFSENRTPVPYDSISPVFFQALIATEDERFYQHHGVDYPGLFAAFKDACRGRARGASTISQQLVKNMFRVRTQYSTGLLGKIPGLSIVISKSKEMIIATRLEWSSTKEEILEMYANTVDYGANSFGIKTAAKTYFDTTPSALKVEEAAVLVGLLKATSAYNPRLNPKDALRRRNIVLENLYNHRDFFKKKYGFAAIPTKRALDSLSALPITLHFSVESAYDGQALYFREALKDYISEKCPELDVYSDGLKIYTTLDHTLQAYAERAVWENMERLQHTFENHWRFLGEPWRDEKGQVIPHFLEDLAKKSDHYKQLKIRFPNEPDSITFYLNEPHEVKLFSYSGSQVATMSTLDSIAYMVNFLHAGFVAMEPETGYVRAYVGDIDFDSWKYDKVQAMRQPGSTFKLFVYATAMKQGLLPVDTRRDEYIRMEVFDKKKNEVTIWQPHNANGYFTNAQIPLHSAFAQSINTIAVKLGQEVGIKNVIETAKAMGINSPLEDTPSLALGASDVNLFELVNAYATVANSGIHVAPVMVTKITDSEGHVLFEAQKESTLALSRRAAFYMQRLLEAACREGNATSLTMSGSKYLGPYYGKLDYGGKTGTSNNHSDAWFVGVTPGLVGGAWVGGEYRSIHFRTGQLGQGSRTALPIVAQFLRSVMEDPAYASRYLRKYEPAPEGISKSTYLGRPFVPPSLEEDSLSADSTGFVPLDLMGGEGTPLDASAPASHPSSTSSGASSGEVAEGM